MEQEYFPEKTNVFNLYIEDNNGENRRQAENVISVELPKLVIGAGGDLLSITPVRIFFKRVEDALALLKAEETHLRVRAAEQVHCKDGGYLFKGRQHILTIERTNRSFSPGITKHGEPSYAFCEFEVKEYTMTLDEVEVLYVSMEDKILRIN